MTGSAVELLSPDMFGSLFSESSSLPESRSEPTSTPFSANKTKEIFCEKMEKNERGRERERERDKEREWQKETKQRR